MTVHPCICNSDSASLHLQQSLHLNRLQFLSPNFAFLQYLFLAHCKIFSFSADVGAGVGAGVSFSVTVSSLRHWAQPEHFLCPQFSSPNFAFLHHFKSAHCNFSVTVSSLRHWAQPEHFLCPQFSSPNFA